MIRLSAADDSGSIPQFNASTPVRCKPFLPPLGLLAYDLAMRLRTVFTYVVIALAGCTCESEHRELALHDAPPARLEADYSKELGCAGAGGHGFGIILPDVDKTYDQRITIESGPLAGEYPVQCACEGTSAELSIDEDGQRALVGCDERWDVYYFVPDAKRLHCLSGKFDARPEWSAVPSFPDGAFDLMGARFSASIARDVWRLNDDATMAALLAKTATIAGRDWVELVEELPEASRVPVFEALREALAADPVSRTALDRAHVLLPQDRELTKAAVLRHVSSSHETAPHHLRAYYYHPAQRALQQLARARTDDLAELACTMLSLRRCDAACLDVFAGTDASCPDLDAYLSRHVCGADDVCEGSCTVESLTAKVHTDGVRATEVAAARAYLAAMRRPELAGLLDQWERRTYQVDRGPDGCNPGLEFCRCTHDHSLQRAACKTPMSETAYEHLECDVRVDDATRTLFPKPRPDLSADAGPSRPDMDAGSALD